VILKNAPSPQPSPPHSGGEGDLKDLTGKLYEKGWGKADILNLYNFIDWIVTLPVPFELKYQQEIQRLEEEKHVEYISSAERIGIAKGRIEGQCIILMNQLKYRFPDIPEKYQKYIQEADGETLLKLGKKLLEAKSLEEVFN
jgi:hypothetical protein